MWKLKRFAKMIALFVPMVVFSIVFNVLLSIAMLIEKTWSLEKLRIMGESIVYDWKVYFRAYYDWDLYLYNRVNYTAKLLNLDPNYVRKEIYRQD